MRTTLPVALLCGLLVGQGAEAQEGTNQHSRWVIVATVVDRTTGKRLQQSRLEEPELQFDDPAACQSILRRVQPVSDEHVTVVLTCREVAPEGDIL
jgi:hypothetical protein